jgi:pimeloyl-ACP methyl ester carboxylesterase
VTSMRPLPKPAAFCVLALVAAALAAVLPASAASAARSAQAPPTAGVTWGPCPEPAEGAPPLDPRQQCATVPAPLDYRSPSGRRIEVAISRIAAPPATRRGVLLLNPGGPGGPGLDLPSLLAPLLPEEVQARYDLIGFDPRGVAHSTPVTCGLTPVISDQTKVIPYPSPSGDISENIAFAGRMARACHERSGDLLRFVTTANTARDMDRIRAALGENKISYLGYSYGTYLGAVYANLFPERTDRFVLDSAVDPTRVWREVWKAFGPAVAARLPDFLQWVADRDDTYGLGRTRGQLRRLYFRLAADLDRDPVTVEGIEVDGNLFREITRRALYSTDSFPTAAATWRLIRDAAEGRAPGADPRALARAVQQVPADSTIAVLWGIACNDVRWPLTPRGHAIDVRRDRREFPASHGMPANIWPCAFWPTGPIEPLVPITAKGPHNILIPQALRDPATPLFGAVNMRRALGSRARMVVADAGGHPLYGFAHNGCADRATTRFLVSGRLPAADVFCRAEGETAPPAAAMTTRQRNASNELRNRMHPM